MNLNYRHQKTMCYRYTIAPLQEWRGGRLTVSLRPVVSVAMRLLRNRASPHVNNILLRSTADHDFLRGTNWKR